jgi:hypothetical protein
MPENVLYACVSHADALIREERHTKLILPDCRPLSGVVCMALFITTWNYRKECTLPVTGNLADDQSQSTLYDTLLSFM